MKISYIEEIVNDSPAEKICTVLLYGIANEQGKEIGRFVLDKRIFIEKEYEANIDQEKHTVEKDYLRKWKKEVLEPLVSVIKALEKDSIKNNK